MLHWMVSYEIVREIWRGLGKWAIRVILNGVPQEGTMGAGYQAEAEARYWVEQLTAADNVYAERSRPNVAGRALEPHQRSGHCACCS